MNARRCIGCAGQKLYGYSVKALDGSTLVHQSTLEGSLSGYTAHLLFMWPMTRSVASAHTDQQHLLCIADNNKGSILVIQPGPLTHRPLGAQTCRTWALLHSTATSPSLHDAGVMYKVLLGSQQALVHGIAAHAVHVFRGRPSRLLPVPADYHGVSLALKQLISSDVFGRGLLQSIMNMRTCCLLRSGGQSAADPAALQESAHQHCLMMPARIRISHRLGA